MHMLTKLVYTVVSSDMLARCVHCPSVITVSKHSCGVTWILNHAANACMKANMRGMLLVSDLHELE